MAQGLGSLASGFLAGFQTMDNYQRGQKADKRADKAEERADKNMSLREAESQRNAEHQQWSRDRTERRDEVGDKQWDKSYQLQKSNAERGWAQLSLQQRRAKLSEQRENRQMQMLEEQNYLSKSAHIIQSIYNDPSIVNDNPELLKVFEHPAAAHLDPRRFANPEMMKANKTVVGHISNVVSMGASGELQNKSDQEMYSLINTPEVTSALEKTLSYELGKGVGDIDEDTGKVIKSKGKPSIIPGPSGQGVMIAMEVTYNDGSKANKPVTIGRGTGSDDDVAEIPIQHLIQYFGNQGNVIQSLSESGVFNQASQALGYSKQPDNSGYRKEAAAQLKEEAKQLSNVDKMVAKDEIDSEAALELKAGIKQSFAEQGRSLGELYGFNSKAKETPQENFKAWVSGDQGKQAFAQAMAESGELKELMTNPERRDQLYKYYIEEVEIMQKNEAAALLQEKRRHALGEQ